MSWGSMHPRGPKFLLWGVGEVLDLFCSHFVTNKFPMSSQYIPQVPNALPNIFPIAPHFISS
jgi:hypothetical protein